MYRRRPLSGAFTHPSCMVYPEQCDPEPEAEPEAKPVEIPEWRRPSITIESFDNPSK